MQFKWHILIGFIVSFILVRFIGFSPLAGLIIFLVSVLIDGDHYLWYAIEMNDWNALRWYNNSIPKWFSLSIKERNKFKRGGFVLHSAGFWIILLILSFVHSFFLWVFLGVTLHMISDLLDLVVRGEPLYNKLCPLYVIKRNKNKKSLGEL